MTPFPVHLVRHGQTSSYEGDPGLTELGVHQARDRGRALVEVVQDGERVAFLHAPTERAKRTAECIREALLEAPSTADLDEPRADPGFANVTVWVDGQAYEPTRVRGRHERLVTAKGNQPGWVAEPPSSGRPSARRAAPWPSGSACRAVARAAGLGRPAAADVGPPGGGHWGGRIG